MMTIDEAVVVLNRERWANMAHWKASPSGEYVTATEHTYRAEDAIAIASWLALREAVKRYLDTEHHVYANRCTRCEALRKLAALIGTEERP